jgi:hypothetical protein
MMRLFMNMHIVAIGFTLTHATPATSQNPHPLGTLAGSMVPGSWAELAVEPPPNGWFDFLTEGTANSMFQFADSAVWDPASERVYFLGQGHGGISMMIYYDAKTNRFERETSYNPALFSQPIGHAYDHNALDAATGTFYFSARSPEVVSFHIPTRTWKRLPNRSSAGTENALEFFPSLGLVHISAYWGEIEIFDGTKWMRRHSTLYKDIRLAGYYHNIAEYNPVHDILVFGGGNNFQGNVARVLWKMDRTGAITRMKDAPVGLRITCNGCEGGLFTLDPVSGVFLHLNNNGHFYEFDPIADRWAQLPDDGIPSAVKNAVSLGTAAGNMIAASIPTYGVVFYMKHENSKATVWLYRHAAGLGVDPPKLSPPSPALPAPTPPPPTSPVDGGPGGEMPESDEPLVARINFQPPDVPPPLGFAIDDGSTYSTVRGYGWNGALTPRQRGVTGQTKKELDTLVVRYSGAPAEWNMSVPNGTYLVTTALGDSAWSQGPHHLAIEGRVVVNGTFTAANQFTFVQKEPVEVKDGKLTFVLGSTTAPSSASVVNYVVVERPCPTVGCGDPSRRVPDTQPPTRPENLSAIATASTRVQLQWSASTDNVGVSGYDVYRDGNRVGSSAITSYVDGTVKPSTLVSYAITAKDAAGNISAPSMPVSLTTPPLVSQPPPATASGIVISNDSPTEVRNRTISIGRAFRSGEHPAFVRALVDGAPVLTQTDVKNRWPDGSLRFAVVSFVLPRILSGQSLSVRFESNAAGNNEGYLSSAAMLDPRFDFETIVRMIGARTQQISAREMLTSGQFRYWLKGPVVTSVIIENRTPARSFDVDMGDGSKALHPIFEARFFPSDNSVEVTATVENAWSSSSVQQSMRDVVYSLSIESGWARRQMKFTHPSFNHIGRSRWHRSFLVGNERPPLRIDHNVAYLTATKTIANYDTSVVVADSLVNSLYTQWTASDRTLDGDSTRMGLYNRALGQAGASPWIGLMPTWETVYLLTMRPELLEMTLGHAELAGRFPVHFREADASAGTHGSFLRTASVETFGRVVSVDARRTVTLTDLGASCGTSYDRDRIQTGPITTDGWSVSIAHLPSPNFLAYLLTGKYFHLEEVQFLGAYVAGSKLGCYGGNYARQGDAGYVNHTNVRGDAWGFKALVQAAFLSPDGSPERSYFDDKVRNNIAMFEGVQNLALSDPSRWSHWNWGRNNRAGNPYWQALTGWTESPIGQWSTGTSAFIQSPLRSDGALLAATSPWEENFMLISLGMARQYGYPTESLLEFMAPLRFQLMLDPASNVYLIESYRWPTVSAATSNWVTSASEVEQYFQEVPNTWRSLTADHSYRFIAMAALSFLYEFEVDGRNGGAAWEKLRAISPQQDEFGTASPKWAIVPHGSSR